MMQWRSINRQNPLGKHLITLHNNSHQQDSQHHLIKRHIITFFNDAMEVNQLAESIRETLYTHTQRRIRVRIGFEHAILNHAEIGIERIGFKCAILNLAQIGMERIRLQHPYTHIHREIGLKDQVRPCNTPTYPVRLGRDYGIRTCIY